jgi:stage III sporulation protein AA
MKCGCKILATVHGADVEDLKKKRVLREMAEERMFERYVVLKRIPSPGTVDGIYDGEMQRLKGDWA